LLDKHVLGWVDIEFSVLGLEYKHHHIPHAIAQA
jgi:hypothetical protein